MSPCPVKTSLKFQKQPFLLVRPIPGNTAEDIERFVTDPIEEGVKGISNIVEITSTSQDDYAIVAIEFDEEIEVDLSQAKDKG